MIFLSENWQLCKPRCSKIDFFATGIILVNSCPSYEKSGVFLPGPSVDSGNFKSEVPRPGILPLTLGPSADSVSVSFAIFPATTVSATVVEVEPTTIDVRLVGRRHRRAGRRRRSSLCRHHFDRWWFVITTTSTTALRRQKRRV